MQRHFHLLQNSLSSSWKQIITFQYVYFYYNTAFMQEFLLRQPQRNGVTWLVLAKPAITALCLKNEPTLANCSFVKHGLIWIIFGKQHQHTFKNYMHLQLSLYLHFY